MTATSARATLSPAAALARHDHRYWHARYREHLLLSAVALCGCQDGGQLCPDGQRFNDEADAAGKRWERAGKEGQYHPADRGGSSTARTAAWSGDTVPHVVAGRPDLSIP
jgi:hypothetical protein